MLLLTKDVLKELLIVLVMLQVVKFFIPRPLRRLVNEVTKAFNTVMKGMTDHAIKRVKFYLKQREKVTQKHEQPQHENVITVRYPDNRIKKYNVK